MKHLYVVDHFVPFPQSEYGGNWNVVADDDGNIISVDIGDDVTAEAITHEDEGRIILNQPFVPGSSEVILDSISSPRTVDDIVFLPFINYRYQ